MAITPLPTPPTRQDPVNFADRADTFLAALPTFATEVNADLGVISDNFEDVQVVSDNIANINAAVADLPALSEKVSKTGDTMVGPLSVPAGASGNQVPRRSEVVGVTGNESVGGVKTFTSKPKVPAGATGDEVPQAQETYGPKNGQLAGMRNKIINGKMEIAQRGTSFAPANSGVYTLDRWVPSSSTTGVVTISQQADVPSSNEFQSSLRVAVTTADTSIASSDNLSIFQNIEGYNARDLIGRSFTLSFWVRSSKTGTHCVSMRNTGGDRSLIAEYTVSSANTWEFKTVTVTGGLVTAGTWNWTNGLGLSLGFSLACGNTFQTTPNAWQTGNFFATSNQVNCLDTIGNIFAITGVQLEVGEVATPFEHRPIGTELALCQRYYEIAYQPTSGSSYGFFSALFNTTGSESAHTWYFAVPKRATPTFTLLSSTGWQVGTPSINPTQNSILFYRLGAFYTVGTGGAAAGAASAEI